MPCLTFDALIKEWNSSQREDALALDAHVSRGMSVARRKEWRDRARAGLRNIERKLNSHIRECTACVAEGHTPTFNLAESHE